MVMAIQYRTRSDNWIRRAGPAEIGCPKNGELRLPTGKLSLTRFVTLNASMPTVVVRLPRAAPGCAYGNSCDQRRSSAAYEKPRSVLRPTPGGRALAMPVL